MFGLPSGLCRLSELAAPTELAVVVLKKDAELARKDAQMKELYRLFNKMTEDAGKVRWWLAQHPQGPGKYRDPRGGLVLSIVTEPPAPVEPDHSS